MTKPLFLLFILAAPLAARADQCGSHELTFTGATAAEKVAACTSLTKIADHFHGMGVSLSGLKMKLTFEDQVRLPDPWQTPVHAYFDTDDNSIHMTHFDSASQKERKPWGLDWSEEMATSFLLHEMAHLYAISYMGNSFRQVVQHWQEVIAYSVQLSLMSDALRAKVLASAPGISVFGAPDMVSSFYYQADPEKYAMRSYLSVEAWGGKRFLKDVIDLKVNEARNSAF